MASAWGNSWGAYWGNSWGSISVRRQNHAGRKKRKRKVFVELDGEILLFDRPDQAYSFLQGREALVKSALTGKVLKKPVKPPKVEVKPEVINLPQLEAYVEDQRLGIDIALLLRRLNFIRLLEIQQEMDDEIIILLMGA